jgi:hypothetical protein
MKPRQSRRQTAKVSHSRWLAYATASAATALASTHSAEATIHYSGILNVQFRPHRDTDRTFPLDQAGDFLVFNRHEVASSIRASNIGSVAVVPGGVGGCSRTRYSFNSLASKLYFGQNVSDGCFRFGGRHFMAYDTSFSGSNCFFCAWGDRGPGFVGFYFNNGAGTQYGWVRIRMFAFPEHGFEVVSYAYADPGEPIRAGQKSSHEQVPDQDSTDEQAPDQGSLGGLALGAVGLLAWRKSRSRNAHLENA